MPPPLTSAQIRAARALSDGVPQILRRRLQWRQRPSGARSVAVDETSMTVPRTSSPSAALLKPPASSSSTRMAAAQASGSGKTRGEEKDHRRLAAQTQRRMGYLTILRRLGASQKSRRHPTWVPRRPLVMSRLHCQATRRPVLVGFVSRNDGSSNLDDLSRPCITEKCHANRLPRHPRATCTSATRSSHSG